MRTKSNVEWSPHSGAPGCHRCGLPLLDCATYCPYCERRLQENAITRLVDRGRATLRAGHGRTIAGLPERLVIMLSASIFGLIAIVSAVAAMLS
jgi:hypothetical protein